MAEHRSNIRSAGGAERTHNNRPYYSDSRSERDYCGSHRAEDIAAHHRSSRVGRHHADRTRR